MLRNVENESYYFEKSLENKNLETEQYQKVVNILDVENIYPFLLVNVGTGVSIIKALGILK